MSLNLTGWNHREWEKLGLEDYGQFCHKSTECNVGEDHYSGYGRWFYIPEKPLANNTAVVYWGTWGNDNSPGASSYTYAEIFDLSDKEDAQEYKERKEYWEGQPEYVEEEELENEKPVDCR